MEFKGNFRIQRDAPAPPCLWKGEGTIYLEKKLSGTEKGPACDFFIKQPFPPLVGEVKVAVPQNSKQVFNTFLKDIEKCRNWLNPKLGPSIEKKFGTSFKYAAAILVDLTRVGGGYFSQWHSEINEKALGREGIIVRLISL